MSCIIFMQGAWEIFIKITVSTMSERRFAFAFDFIRMTFFDIFFTSDRQMTD